MAWPISLGSVSDFQLFRTLHPNISNPCRNDEHGIDEDKSSAHTRRMAKNRVNNRDLTPLFALF
jgi:hypothetical protein